MLIILAMLDLDKQKDRGKVIVHFNFEMSSAVL